MGHIVGKDIYRRLGDKVDQLTLRAPWNRAFHEILKELYTPREADILVSMPYGLSSLSRIATVLKENAVSLRKDLKRLCTKGLVADVWINDEYHYIPSPLAIGLFEFTMMRTGENLNFKGWSRLFHEYLMGDSSVYDANFGSGMKMSLMRTVPHETAIKESPHVEVLDYEKAAAIIDRSGTFGVGICSCRHEKFHIEQKHCDTPLETCMSFGWAADYLIRHGMAKKADKQKALETLEISKEYGLVLNADNVQQKVTYLCQCCGCCCNVLLGYNCHGYENVVVTSSFIAEVENQNCIGCGKCAKACPINAIDMEPVHGEGERRKQAIIDASVCIGCGVCSLKCKNRSLELVKRKQRFIHPETTFHRVILQCLERGTLQNQIFDNPASITQGFMRGLVGGFLKLPPVKKSLMSETLRSSFLRAMETGIKMQGKEWLTTL